MFRPQVERCRFSEMDLGLGGEDLGMAEWLHFMLLRVLWQQKNKPEYPVIQWFGGS